ncbi:PREDICTED: glycine-rich RNA-binding protein 1-like [Priapulus caudatus]|uniref:Glycine-rich RNA-binding protein 1-like n=1 Tax=Priapulus caudatus TaxID=37621 RepID=A0ABM1E3F3_PRICU|nr:PREDICTED: glycine-rich RNA-binding protein 1-like [Priapulus caudatus]
MMQEQQASASAYHDMLAGGATGSGFSGSPGGAGSDASSNVQLFIPHAQLRSGSGMESGGGGSPESGGAGPYASAAVYGAGASGYGGGAGGGGYDRRDTNMVETSQ